MFCPNCGARLGDSEVKCPLCACALPHGEKVSPRLYPKVPRPPVKEDFRGLVFFLTVLFAAAGGMVLTTDLLTLPLTYSPYVLFSLAVFYSAFLFPRWWSKPNPVIFFPVFCICTLGLLWYLDFDLHWGVFFPLILPLLGGLCLLLEALVVLWRYVRGGRFYMFGGFILALAPLSLVGEILFRAALSMPFAVSFSILPMIFFGAVGLGLLTVAIVPPFRRYLERRFFL